MNLRNFSAVAVLALSMMSAGAQAQKSTWTIDSAHSSVGFQIRHLGVSNVHGALTGIKGAVDYDATDPTKSSVVATIDAGTVNTNNDARDKHLKSPDFFDVEKEPYDQFQIDRSYEVGGKLQLLGDLTLNGVTKPVTLDLDGPATPITQRGKLVSGFTATGTIKRADYNFGSKYTSPVLGDDVKLTIELEINKPA